MDRLAALFERFSLRAHVFNAGPLCKTFEYKKDAGHGHIHVIQQGALQLDAPGCSSEVIRAPSLLFYLRPVTHRLTPLPAEPAVTVCGEIDFGDGLENPAAHVLPALMRVRLDDQPALHSTIDLLFNEAFANYCGRQAALDRTCELLVIQLLRLAMNDDDAKVGLLAGLADKRLARALDCIHRAPAESWSLERLARESGMSRASFAARFREAVGMTPGKYLSHWRLGVAKSLLKKGRPLALVAEEVGYSSPAAFSRAFSAHFGTPPAHWLRNAVTESLVR